MERWGRAARPHQEIVKSGQKSRARDPEGLAQLWDRAHAVSEWPIITALPDPFGLLPPGWSAWLVGYWPDEPHEAPRAPVTLPALRPDAPHLLQRRYLAGVVAVGSARCPLCHVLIAFDPRTDRAWLHHESECSTRLRPDELAWLDPLAGVRP